MLALGEDLGPFYAVTAWGDGMVNDQIARIIGTVARRNRVDITSNFVFPKERLKLMPTNGNLNFCASFHPHLWPSVEAFIEKAQWVIAEGFPIAVVGIVGYPPHMKHIERWVGMMRDAGLTANALRFGGYFNGVLYPAAYTDAETKMLLSLNAEPESAEAHLDLYLMSGTPRGRMCHAGEKYVYINWEGDAYRCVSSSNDESRLGSIFGGMKLWDGPRPCTAGVCPCTDLHQYIEEDAPCA
jgi:MoaA/NifB/PqqE/SkfB family radical SAM enzyme